jgi:hypothetical protein
MRLIAVIIISLIFGVLCYNMASRKGYNKQFWLIMGILFGPFALPFIILGKRKDCHGKENRRDNQNQADKRHASGRLD